MNSQTRTLLLHPDTLKAYVYRNSMEDNMWYIHDVELIGRSLLLRVVEILDSLVDSQAIRGDKTEYLHFCPETAPLLFITWSSAQTLSNCVYQIRARLSLVLLMFSGAGLMTPLSHAIYISSTNVGYMSVLLVFRSVCH